MEYFSRQSYRESFFGDFVSDRPGETRLDGDSAFIVEVLGFSFAILSFFDFLGLSCCGGIIVPSWFAFGLDDTSNSVTAGDLFFRCVATTFFVDLRTSLCGRWPYFS